MNYIFLAQSTFLEHFPRSIYSIQLYPETDNPFTSSSLILVWSGQSDKLWIDVNGSLMNDQDRIICLNPPVFLKCNQYFMQEWQRKEQLYGQIIALFDKSKLWEYAVPLCKELCDLYENRCGIKIYLRNSSKKSTLLTSLWPWKLIGSWFKLLIFSRIYDYYKLSNILTLQSSAFQNILTTFRPHPEYFKVSFFGGSYPLFVRNKEFIYRGLDFEKISDFTHRLCAEFPEANLVTKVDKFHYM